MAKRKPPLKPQNMRKLVANQFGIQYAKECHEYYQDTKLHQNFNWQTHIFLLRSMCAVAYRIQVGDENQENIDEAVKQAESTWKYLWKGVEVVVTDLCVHCQRFETLGFECTRDENCDCPKCMDFCECEEEE